MKDVTFYLEFPDQKTKRKSGKAHKGHSGTVVAVWKGSSMVTNNILAYKAVSSVTGFANSSCCSTSVCENYIRRNCKRISEALARRIHPNLFNILDGPTCL